MRYWLMKSEPESFGWDHLWAAPRRTTVWDGVRNYQARNYMRDLARKGDGVLFYHSACAEPGVVGLAEVCSDPHPDPTQFDPESKYFDSTSPVANPRWITVDVKAKRKLSTFVSLTDLRAHTDALGDFALLRRGNRLSVLPVTAEQWAYVLNLGGVEQH